jgi:hypothetical protein
VSGQIASSVLGGPTPYTRALVPKIPKGLPEEIRALIALLPALQVSRVRNATGGPALWLVEYLNAGKMYVPDGASIEDWTFAIGYVQQARPGSSPPELVPAKPGEPTMMAIT